MQDKKKKKPEWGKEDNRGTDVFNFGLLAKIIFDWVWMKSQSCQSAFYTTLNILLKPPTSKMEPRKLVYILLKYTDV